LILGLPGNPVSAACGMLRFGLPLLRKLSGNRQWKSQPLSVLVQNPGEKTLPLHWMRLARLRRPHG
jgi:molybdopterin molybdotransferase